jgi:hypothetical protein
MFSKYGNAAASFGNSSEYLGKHRDSDYFFMKAANPIPQEKRAFVGNIRIIGVSRHSQDSNEELNHSPSRSSLSVCGFPGTPQGFDPAAIRESRAFRPADRIDTPPGGASRHE